MLNLYNTLSRKKEEFISLNDKKVTMYSCGPTVYSYAHIGNMRTYIFMDLLRRVLKYDGFKIKGVMNITDVGHLQSDADEGEDKMEKAAKKEKKTPWEIADYYTTVFFDDLQKLNIGKPEIIAKATEHIDDMIKYVEKLIELGYAYETSDGIYYDISKFKNYGQLSRLNLDEQIAGARVEVNPEKRNPYDFAVWKKAPKEHIMQWPSPWGMGYPGWHIECSAMSIKYLGQHFDIHTGGVDHIPVHHENEIAQNEAITGKKSVNYWCHGEFMLVNNGKMSKSLGNVYTVSDLEKMGYEPLVYRYFCLNAHYRNKLNFTFEGMDGAKTSYNRLLAQVYAHKNSNVATDKEVIDGYLKEFRDAIDDDLNLPLALGVLWKAVKEPKSKDIYNLAIEMDKVFGLRLDEYKPAPQTLQDVPEEVLKLVELRKEAKANKDWANADKYRNEITSLGYQIKDTKEGVEIIKM